MHAVRFVETYHRWAKPSVTNIPLEELGHAAAHGASHGGAHAGNGPVGLGFGSETALEASARLSVPRIASSPARWP